MQNFINNWATNLLLPITDTDTQLVVPVEMADRLTSLGEAGYYLLTLAQINAQGFEQAWEIVKVTGKDAGALTVERAQESTIALAFAGGASVSARLTQAALESLQAGADVPPVARFLWPMPTVPAGLYFDTAHVGGATAGQSLAANEAQLWPWSPIKTVVIDRLSLRVMTAQAGAKVRIGLYAADADGWPTELLLYSAEFALDTTGFKEAWCPITGLDEGKAYWWAVLSSAAPAIDAVTSGYVSLSYVGTSRASCLKAAVSYATGLPGEWPFEVGQIAASNVPIINMRRA